MYNLVLHRDLLLVLIMVGKLLEPHYFKSVKYDK
jgi:hypothetical protein